MRNRLWLFLVVPGLVACRDGNRWRSVLRDYARPDTVERLHVMLDGERARGDTVRKLNRELADKNAYLLTQLNGLIQEQEQDVTLAEKLHPPGPINAAHQRAIDALGLRVGGMKGLADVFRSTATTSDSVQAGTQLAQKAQRLLGWQPRLSNRRALTETYDWYLANRSRIAAAGVTHRVPWNQQALGLLKKIS